VEDNTRSVCSLEVKIPISTGILVAEIGGKQTDFNLWEENLRFARLNPDFQAEQAVIEGLISKAQLKGVQRMKAPKYFFKKNLISYAAAKHIIL